MRSVRPASSKHEEAPDAPGNSGIGEVGGGDAGGSEGGLVHVVMGPLVHAPLAVSSHSR